MASEALVSLCVALHQSASRAEGALRDFIVDNPAARQNLAGLSRDLAEIQTASRLLDRNYEAFDQGNAIVPERLFAALKDVVDKSSSLVGEINGCYLERPSDTQQSRQAWLEHATERLASLSRQAENARIALNLGLDALLFASNSQPADNENGLPPYSTSQMLEEAVSLRGRLSPDSDADDSQVQTQRSTLTEFIDALQAYVEQTSSTLLVPQADGSAPRSSDASSAHSEQLPAIPSYDSISFTNRAPPQISLRHMVKKQLCQREVFEVAVVPRNGQPTIAVSYLESPTRFFSTQLNIVHTISNQHGEALTFSPDGHTWACRCMDQPAVLLGDYVNSKKVQQIRWPGARPLGFSSDGRWLAIGSAMGRIAIVDMRSGANLEKAAVIWCHTEQVTHGMFTPDGRALVSISTDGSIRLTDPETRESLAKLETDTWKKPVFLGVAPDSPVIVSIWGDTVYHWNYTTGALESFSLGGKRSREGWPIAISPDCRFLCCRTDDGVDLSDLQTGRVLYTIKFQNGFATAAAFSSDGKYLALGKAASTMGARVSMSTLDLWELVF